MAKPIAFVCLALAAVGCSKTPPVVGKWVEKGEPATEGYCEFKPDGTYVWNIHVSDRKHFAEIDDAGKYRYENGTLTLDSTGSSVVTEDRHTKHGPQNGKISQKVSVTQDSITFEPDRNRPDSAGIWTRVN